MAYTEFNRPYGPLCDHCPVLTQVQSQLPADAFAVTVTCYAQADATADSARMRATAVSQDGTRSPDIEAYGPCQAKEADSAGTIVSE